MKDPNLLIDWITRYATFHDKKLVVGISGGIDSSTVAHLCARTGIDTYLVSLPLKEEDSKISKLLNSLEKYTNVTYVKNNISSCVDSFLNDGYPIGIVSELTRANMISRVRMIKLYMLANNVNGIVVGTGNKVEDFGVGFFTKYGDGGVDISPIADLLKSEVRSFAKLLGVPESIITATPTDGLWEDGRTDEDQIGCSYDELEWAMNCISVVTDREKYVFDIYTNLHNKNRHKMELPTVYKWVNSEK